MENVKQSIINLINAVEDKDTLIFIYYLISSYEENQSD